MQTLEQLQARALRRADQVDQLDRLLFAAKGKRRSEELRDDSTGLWRALWPDRAGAKVKKLERELTRARAALRIAVDQLHLAHCEQLRAAPWSGSLLRPSEGELRDANEDYHQWNLALMSGKRALSALYKIDAVADSDNPALIIVEVIFGAVTDLPSDEITQKVEAINAAADAIRGFVNVLRILARSHPQVAADTDSAPLVAIADRLSSVRTRIGAMVVSGQVDRAKRTIASILTSVEEASGGQRGGVADAQDRLEQVNHQITLAAWSKIPARLRPRGR